MPAPLQRLDEAGYRALAKHHSPALDATLPRLSRAANHGFLWYAIAALLFATKDRRSRKAAGRALSALAITASIVNLPMKLFFKRGRPEIDGVPLPRRLARAPITSSFPSGHTASAAAFATAASLEMPALAVPLGGIAAAVGLSRVYVGAHYPGDVLAGAAIGASIAVASRRIWRPAASGSTLWDPTIADTVELDDGARMTVVVNPSSGSSIGSDPSDALKEAFPKATFIELNGDVESALKSAAQSKPKVLAVCGGDGTVNAAAQIAVDQKIPLLVVPGGTLNHFARDIAVSSVADTIETARAGAVMRVDVGLIDGKPFLNTASFGAYTDLVDEREQLEDRIGKWPAALVALARVLRRSKAVEVELDGRRRRIWAIFVGNCRYDPKGFAPSSRASMNDGMLDVRVLRAEGRWSRLRLLTAALTGDLSRSPQYEEWTAARVAVRSLNGPLRLARDGETFDGAPDFTIEKEQDALAVLVPRPEEQHVPEATRRAQ